MGTRLRRMTPCTTCAGLLFAALAMFCAGAFAEDPWADAVVDYSPGAETYAPYNDPMAALGAPSGLGVSTPNNASVVRLGTPTGSITLKFNTPVTDDPANPFGLDAIVYSNAFWVGGNAQRKFQEPAIIEISEDGNGNGVADDPWYLVPGSRAFSYVPFPNEIEPAGLDNEAPSPLTALAGNIRNPNLFDADSANDQEEYNWGYAEMTPTQQPYLDDYVRPDDPHVVGLTSRSGGGDAFDIAWAVNASGAPAHLTRFHFIRLTSFVARTMSGLGSATPEIDAVADVAPNVDADGDGVLDEYETRVAGTDPARKESTTLPLEIPSTEGGSSPGTLLGTAQDDRGTILRLFADQARTASDRAYNVNVDILAPVAPTGSLPTGLSKSGCVRQITASVSDFVSAGIQAAEVTMQYTPIEIAGLDEASLQPYLYSGGSYAQTGLSSITLNAAANRVTFRARTPGLFILAAPAGGGDTATQGPQGTIALTATPGGGSTANSANSVHVVSGVIRDVLSQSVANGTLISVAATRGAIVSADADANAPGIQIATLNGAIAFDVQAPTQAGSARFSASSVQGAAYGELLYAFTPGSPSGSASWVVGEPQGSAPVSVDLVSEPLRDVYGNIVADGTAITLDVVDAALTSGDADLVAPGHQALTVNGRLSIVASAPGVDSTFVISAYADSARTQSLGAQTLSPNDYQPMPLSFAAFLLPALFLGAAFFRARRKRSLNS